MDAFEGTKDVIVVNNTFGQFMETYKVDCVVSPGNSLGQMYGGYDDAISKYFGYELTDKVQKYISKNFALGIQPVATSLFFDIPGSKIKFIHTPTMTQPKRIDDPTVVYRCMKATLECAIKNKVKSIVIPAFCGKTGKVNPIDIANNMAKAYKEVFDK